MWARKRKKILNEFRRRTLKSFHSDNPCDDFDDFESKRKCQEMMEYVKKEREFGRSLGKKTGYLEMHMFHDQMKKPKKEARSL